VSSIIALTPLDLTIAAGLVLILAALSLWMRLQLTTALTVAAARTTVQLLLIGVVLKAVFESADPLWLGCIAGIMLAAAGYEVLRRQRRPFRGWWGVGIGTAAMLISAFSITLMALTLIIAETPWYTPRYAIPLLGMLLGNTMNGISIGLDRLTGAAWDQRDLVEGRLLLGYTAAEAIAPLRRECIRSALIPIINSMSAAGLVSLPGMMTGQILAGNPPMEAVKYQILIMFLIAGGTGLGTLAALWLGSRRLFDDRQRLRLDRLRTVAK
jgi:putative ABC transport system permease protein